MLISCNKFGRVGLELIGEWRLKRMFSAVKGEKGEEFVLQGNAWATRFVTRGQLSSGGARSDRSLCGRVEMSSSKCAGLESIQLAIGVG